MPEAPNRVYITGKISGLPEEEYKRLFAEAATLLRGHGFEPVNPLDVKPECEESCDSGLKFDDGSYQHKWQCYMKYDIIEMLKCDAIFPLDNHFDSAGARLEMEIASRVGLPLIFKVDPVNGGGLDW